MPSGKGLVPEHHPHFFGTYWGVMCTGYCGEIVESGDAYVFVGPIFNDYSSVGYSLLIKKETSVIVQPNRVTIGNGPLSDWVFMVDFLTALAKKLKKNSTAYENYHRIFVPPGIALERENNEPLRDNMLFKDVQVLHSVMLRLQNMRVIACVGDGSFQVTAQDISMMMGYGHRSIIFLIDNGGYPLPKGNRTQIALHVPEGRDILLLSLSLSLSLSCFLSRSSRRRSNRRQLRLGAVAFVFCSGVTGFALLIGVVHCWYLKQIGPSEYPQPRTDDSFSMGSIHSNWNETQKSRLLWCLANANTIKAIPLTSLRKMPMLKYKEPTSDEILKIVNLATKVIKPEYPSIEGIIKVTDFN
ncbi:hypothetical protein Vadar_033116 [Vaccinium darrowii]|uniref:Uncharacterized protein n=1 Tax=Vaccinium darrowii TaxID=229202 RepID=A0ACB7ZG33_9ERIC|nr:hypothetical protein Vadar_033116 [Vaccinium darrowii]